MAFKIMPHGRLQEWVAHEKGFFTAEGLEYDFVGGGDYGVHRHRRDGPARSRPALSRRSGPGGTART